MDIREWTERTFAAWNARDQDAFLALGAPGQDLFGPGGFSGHGEAGARHLWQMWQGGFPDSRLSVVRTLGSGDSGAYEAIFEGTHTGVLHSPSGDLPPTGQHVRTHFAGLATLEDGRATSLHLYFDQVELLVQLGLAPAPATAGRPR